ncbi:MAG: lipoyl(octanoyl) transferase LipB [Alphaproteobacteria bacterium]|nr:lipoyl(octanoyl) transferase LipB [Alphaproteobacteria bacterium]
MPEAVNPFPPPVEWRIDDAPVAYPTALADMDRRTEAIRAGAGPERVWLLEHPALYTRGTSASDDELLDPRGAPVFAAGRGGRYTYHGPGQRIGYVQIDLRRRGSDVRRFVGGLENWVIAALDRLNVRAFRREGRIGIWVAKDGGEAKIAAIGVRVRHWVTSHGFAVNVDPDLAAYAGIVPCGIREYGVTSLADLGHTATLADVDLVLRETWPVAVATWNGGPA